MKKILLPIFFMLFTAHALAKNELESSDSPQLTMDVAAKYAIYSMVSSNTYHKAETERINFPIEILGWHRVDLNGNPTNLPTKTEMSGLAYDIYEKQNSNQVIFSFRGTDSKTDYFKANFAIPPFNTQYRQANEQFKYYLDTHKNKSITLTGHSLGGGLALTMSVRHGIDAVVFDSTPQVSDGFRNVHKSAIRVMIYEDGEIMEWGRKILKKKFLKIVPWENTYKAEFNFGEHNGIGKLAKASHKHRLDYLALGLLQFGASVDDNLKLVLDALEQRHNK